MQSITLHSHVGEDGILHLDIPVGLTDAELEVTVTVQTVTTPEGQGWTPGFFEKTFGAWEGEPLTRGDQGELQEREPVD